jgi:hypothetical protein
MNFTNACKKLKSPGQGETFRCDVGIYCFGYVKVCETCGQYHSVCDCGYYSGLCSCHVVISERGVPDYVL